MRRITFGFIHCSATRPSMDIGAAEIRRWHLKRGWRDNGYAFVLRRNGRVEFGRDLDDDGDVFEEIGAHVRGYNAKSFGVCLIGGKWPDGRDARATDSFDDHFTRDQEKALGGLMCAVEGARPNIRWLGHNAVAAKGCPGFQVDNDFLKRMGVRT